MPDLRIVPSVVNDASRQRPKQSMKMRIYRRYCGNYKNRNRANESGSDS